MKYAKCVMKKERTWNRWISSEKIFKYSGSVIPRTAEETRIEYLVPKELGKGRRLLNKEKKKKED